ncbi:transposase [Accumulibacter sp.]|uniref:transposase n=1 Tax=Accumulibacter sp. TaxID=2053492 RepID=UPI00258AEA3D|nr:transposase [Accumulibacter sp.]
MAERLSRKHEVTNAQWAAVRDLMPRYRARPGFTPEQEARSTLNAYLWRSATSRGWAALPTVYGNPRTMSARIKRLLRSAVFKDIIDRLHPNVIFNDKFGEGFDAIAASDPFPFMSDDEDQRGGSQPRLPPKAPDGSRWQ